MLNKNLSTDGSALSRRALIGSGLALSAIGLGGAATASPVVETTGGRLRGEVRDGVSAFRGVPYADDSGGRNRFMPPRPPKPWAGVFEATKYPAHAPQTPDERPAPRSPRPLYPIWASFMAREPESEDCLGLSVWTPGLDNKKRPVMFWLHSGGFFAGAGAEPPTIGHNLAKLGDVVVVSINHRLSVLGYFYLEGFGAQYAGVANQGQLDQVAALQWVRDNIAAFGGDPDNVTIFGQSGGGAKVCTLMTMPQAKGLFHKAVCQSGSYIECATPELADRGARAIMAEVGLQPGEIDKLQQLPARQIVTAWAKLGARGLSRAFTPVRDGKIIPFDPFSPGALGLSHHVPLMIGSTHTEATSLQQDAEAFDLTWETLPRKWAQWSDRRNGDPSLQEPQVKAQIAAFRAAFPNETASQLYFRFTSDLWTILNAIEIADRKSAAGGAPVFMYELTFPTPVDGGRWGSPHSLDLPLIFSTLRDSSSIVADTPDARAVSVQMRSAWTAFARTGDPNNRTLPAWPKFDPTARPAMLFDVTSRVLPDYRAADRRILAGVPTMRV